jgi:uncharacterized membrane protein YagU involved in acid resistance
MMKAIRGAAGGLVATAIMTTVIYAGKALGLLQEPPPKQITENAERSAGVEPGQMPETAFTLSWLASHFGFGAVGGLLYPWLRRAYPGPPLISGALYGLSIWFQAYLGFLPELNLYPRATEDSTSRQAVMVAAHIVYGATVGVLSEDEHTET